VTFGAPLARYVAGFMFSQDRQFVVLIRKQKPAWQKGKLNGIGGKVEAEESSLSAMVREFQEETGFQTTASQWSHFCKMEGKANDDGGAFIVHFFATLGDLTLLKSMEAEQLESVIVASLHPLHPETIENLPWLIALALALDHLADGRPAFVTATYP